MGIIRVLVGFALAIGMTAAWMLLALIVMAISLYVARLIPLSGRKPRKPRRPEDVVGSSTD